ncbi:MAG: PilN domain-containing protein [Candidatus Zixiibacteriota bacterium]|nr:MAG: PilN domain-containing protein [candidate division Zixibacteria bacterium]
MIEINLLPKELQYKRFALSVDKNVVFIIIGGLVIAGLLAAYSFVLQASKFKSLQEDIIQAENETARYSAEIQKIEDITLKKAQILARMSAIQVLDQNRDYWVIFLEDLVRRVPEYVWLTSVVQNPSAGPTAGAPGAQPAAAKSSIEGYSFSLNAFATFLIRLKKSDLFHDIELTSINLEETDQAKAYSFKITCNFATQELPAATAETVQQAPAAGTQF